MEARYAWTDLSHRIDRGDHGDPLFLWTALSGTAINVSWQEVAVAETRIATVDPTLARIQWSAVIAGAVVASAVAFVLHAFAGAIGISISSAAPTWRDASFALMLLSGLYLLIVALAAYASGAYVAGRLRPRLGGAADGSSNDGMHGLLVWALATLLTGVMAIALAVGATRLAAPSGASAGPATSVAGENIIAFDIDRLFRGRQMQGDVSHTRAEAARILLTASSHRGMQDEDRAYLVRLVSANTGLAQADAERRVAEVSARANENIRRARHSAAILAFMAAAATLLGAAAAWFAAATAGAHRDGLEPIPEWLDWDKTLSPRA
jgi:hypothetical protein